MNVSDQDLKHFKSLLLNDKFEEAKKILVQNKGDFKKELGVKIVFIENVKVERF